MQAFEMLVPAYQSIWHNTPEDCDLHHVSYCSTYEYMNKKSVNLTWPADILYCLTSPHATQRTSVSYLYDMITFVTVCLSVQYKALFILSQMHKNPPALRKGHRVALL